MARKTALRFVVQRHRASRLHYDFRLEMHGVLVSWAVPKGPTLDPDVRRQAIAVEDHEVDYIDFEGVIPEGHYGAGDVIVWDTGTWQPAETDSPEQALADGSLHFDLAGTKLKGRFVLTRTSRGWLLLHKKDSFAVAGWNPEDHPESVLSGRTNDQVAAEAA
jgi:bifunctional non-homologous end joining protein LigD